MKAFFYFLTIAMVLSFNNIALAQSAQTGNITLTVTNLNNDKGVVRIALFNSENSYSSSAPSANQAFMKGIAEIHSKEAVYTFNHVPYGEYAIKMFHDQDNNGKFVTGMFGIPKVQYAFSNNAHGSFGPAKYNKAKFTLNQPQLTQTIHMIGQ